MTRRDSLKILALAAGAGALPGLALLKRPAGVAVYDGRYAEARAFARTAQQAHDCQADPASVWFAHFAAPGLTIAEIAGLTTAADAMILADCARREGYAFEAVQPSPGKSALVAWTITRKMR